MMNRFIQFFLFFCIGVLFFGWFFNYRNIEKAQQDKFMEFVNKGQRFTAKDGQELCERIQKLESNPSPCRYTEPRK